MAIKKISEFVSAVPTSEDKILFEHNEKGKNTTLADLPISTKTQTALDAKVNTSDVLTLGQIQTTPDLTGKVTGASALKDFITTGTFKANLTAGTNTIKISGSATDKVVEGTLPKTPFCFINIFGVSSNNNFDWSYHFDSGGNALYIDTTIAQTLSFEWLEFNIQVFFPLPR